MKKQKILIISTFIMIFLCACQSEDVNGINSNELYSENVSSETLAEAQDEAVLKSEDNIDSDTDIVEITESVEATELSELTELAETTEPVTTTELAETTEEIDVNENAQEIKGDAYSMEYFYLEEFESLLNQMVDPPDDDLDDIESYYEEEYDLWEAGETFNNIVIGDDGHLKFRDEPDKYIGSYIELYSSRCSMKIYGTGLGYISISIKWSGGASMYSEWVMSGWYDDDNDVIRYNNGVKNEVTYCETGETESTNIYSDGTGIIYFKDDGYLYWDDYKDDVGAKLYFSRYEGD
jgi:hypothetical protein